MGSMKLIYREIRALSAEVDALQRKLQEMENIPEEVEEESEVYEAAKKVPERKPKEDVIDIGEQHCHQADCAYYGHGVPQSYKNAFNLYNLAASEGCGRAYGCLGKMYEAGVYVDKDLALAFDCYSKGAKLNDSTSLFALGKYYEKNIVPEDEEVRGMSTAVEYYLRARDLKNHEAITRLAYMHEHGIYFDVNKELALKSYKEAAELGNPIAKNYMGLVEYRKKNFKAAVELFRKSKELGCARAANNLGMCYEQGMGVEKDPDKALKCYEEAAEKKYPPGMYNLGYIYLKKAEFTKQYDQFFKATYWFRAALAEDPKMMDANFYLGFLYEKGLGVDKDYHTAYSYYRKAANLGHAKACKRCGDFLYSGCGLLRTDRPEAFTCYVKAAELGDEEAYNALGLMYEKGFERMNRNPRKAAENYVKAHEMGCTDASINLAFMHLKGSGVEKDVEKANGLMLYAAKKGNTKARDYLIANGIVPTIQHVKEIKYLKEKFTERRRDIPLLIDPEFAQTQKVSCELADLDSEANLTRKYENGTGKCGCNW
eukprot:TRINITY_DN12290_c0_g1_i9.p1 TRINITY_DN12290_c0_g1~~TRINITY_DN12290_c0_g1_i9.p1  ORF type:complete len:542 (-),score=167.04 TRINITY_DN12290_c0_g1_i9:652-2277(-)